MSILSPGGTAKGLCAGDTHVFQLGSPTCDCGAWGAAAPSLTKPYPLSGGVIPGYTPNSFTPPRPPTPPIAGAAPDVPIYQFKAAQRSGGSHLSADGKRVYTVRYGVVLEAGWNAQAREYGAWGPAEEGKMPGNAVEM